MANQRKLILPRKQKILHVITALETGGAEGMLYKLLKTMNTCETPLEHYILTLVDSGKYRHLIKNLGIPVFTLGMNKGMPSIQALWKGKRLIQEIKPDVVQGWMYHGNLLAAMITPRNVRMYWNIRQSLYSFSNEKWHTRLAIRLGGLLSRSTQGIIYNSQTAIRQHEKIGYSNIKSIYIPNGFDSNEFYADSICKNIFIKRHRIPPKSKVIGTIGRFHPMKDHVTFIKAADLISRNRNDVVFVMVGKDLNWKNREITDAIKNLGLENKFWLLDEQNNVAEILNSFDVFLLTSAWGEAFPNVIGEALFCNVPVLATDVGDVTKLCRDSYFICETRDYESLAKKTMELLNGDVDEVKFKNIVNDFKSSFEIKKISQTYANLYINKI